jgi:hypothetical protein
MTTAFDRQHQVAVYRDPEYFAKPAMNGFPASEPASERNG